MHKQNYSQQKKTKNIECEFEFYAVDRLNEMKIVWIC